MTTDYPVQGPADESPDFRRAVDAAIGNLSRDNGIELVQHAIPPERIDDIVSAVHKFVISH